MIRAPVASRGPFGRGRAGVLGVLALSLAVTLFNAAKPLHIDDPFVYRIAEQIVKTPSDPYGFDVFWYQWPQPVFEEVTPPVLPYWWAAGLALFGDSPWLWKLWLWPFVFLFSYALYRLLQHFARGVELPLTALTVLSPAVLPGLNMMQDVPGYALGMSALLIHLRSAATRPVLGALAAGLVAGLATQTKWAAGSYVAAILVHGLLVQRRIAPATLTACTALLVFAGWEGLVTARYGQGMFLSQAGFDFFWEPRWAMAGHLVWLLGAVLGPVALVGVCAASPTALTLALAGALLAGYAALLVAPLQHFLFPLTGVLVVATLLASVTLPVWPAIAGRARAGSSSQRVEWFLLVWLAGEIVAYFVTAPFPAVRRILGLVIVATLVVGRRAAGAHCQPLVLWTLVASSAALGLFYYAVDLREAQAQQRGARWAAAEIRRVAPDARIWFTGHWGFKYYAERAGMQALVPDHSQLLPGDWVVIPSRVHQPELRFPAGALEPRDRQVIRDFPPLSTSWGYYATSTPLEPLGGPRLVTTILRVRAAAIPETPWPVERLARWLLTAGGDTASWALPALLRRLDDPSPEVRRHVLEVLGQVGPRAAASVSRVTRALDDPDASVRAEAARALDRIGTPRNPASP